MKKAYLASAAVLAAAFAVTGIAHAEDTLKKIKDSGVITEGVRESSGALAFTLGDGKYAGYHYDVCAHIIADIQKHLGMAKSGEAAKLYDKWFMKPIPPSNTTVGLAASEATKAAWANPSDKPLEDYAQP